MRKRKMDSNARFLSPRVAAEQIGISYKQIYAGCQNGTIPHIRVGRDYRIDMEEWGRMLTEESRSNLKRKEDV